MPAPADPSALTLASTACPWGSIDPALLVFRASNVWPVNKAAARITYTPTASSQTRIETKLGSNDWSFAGVTGDGVGAVVIAKLTPAGAYQVRIRAENAGGFSNWVTASFTAPLIAVANTPPTAPTSLVVDQVTHSRARFTWTDNSGNEGTWKITVRTTGSSATERSVFIYAFKNPVTLDIAAMFGREVAAELFTAHIIAVGGTAKASVAPAIESAPSADVAFTMLAAAVRIITVPGSSTAYTALAYSKNIALDGPATSMGASGLPTGLTLNFTPTDDFATITGTTSAAPGIYSVTLTATNAGGTDTEVITIRVVASALNFKKSAVRDYITAPGQAFSILFTFDVIGAAAPTTLTLSGHPAWLAVDGFSIEGTAEEGDFTFNVTVTNGVLTDTIRIRVLVPAVQITSSATLTAFTDQAISFYLSASQDDAVFSGDGLPAGLTVSEKTHPDTLQYLTGAITAVGVYEFVLEAAAGDSITQQDFTLTVKSAVNSALDSISVEVGQQVNEGPFIYQGAGSIREWSLSGAPSGLGLTVGTTLDPGEGSEEYVSEAVAFITGSTTQVGIFDATVHASADVLGAIARHSWPVRIYVSGGLFIAWLHSDPTLFDLQVPLRGDGGSRLVRSFYETPAVVGKTAVSASTTDGVTTTETVVTPAAPAITMTLKRGDQMKLAIVVRDGSTIVVDGVSAVRFTLRTSDAQDEDYVLDEEATSTTIDGGTYWLVELEITNEWIEELTAGDSLTDMELLGEISFEYGSLAYSSRTCSVRLVEDVGR